MDRRGIGGITNGDPADTPPPLAHAHYTADTLGPSLPCVRWAEGKYATIQAYRGPVGDGAQECELLFPPSLPCGGYFVERVSDGNAVYTLQLRPRDRAISLWVSVDCSLVIGREDAQRKERRETLPINPCRTPVYLVAPSSFIIYPTWPGISTARGPRWNWTGTSGAAQPAVAPAVVAVAPAVVTRISRPTKTSKYGPGVPARGTPPKEGENDEK